MAYWAEIDSNNSVLRVTVGNDNEPDKGYQWLIDNLGGTWVETFDNDITRGTYAGIGWTYNLAEDIFVTPQPYPSWVRTGSFWNAPIPMPTDDAIYSWNEDELSWQVVTTE